MVSIKTPVIASSRGQPILDENSQIGKIEQTKSDIYDQNASPFTELENMIRNAKAQPSSSEALEEGGSKAKKTGGKKSKPKSVQTQLIPVSLKSSDINKEKLRISYDEMVERSIKNIANTENILEK